VRSVRLAGEALFYLLVPGLGAIALLTCVNELRRAPDEVGLLGGTVPITEHKWPWALALIALLLVAWLVVRAVGGASGWVWGALLSGLRVVFWWSVAALLLFLGVAIYGFATHPLADLSWPFTLGYLLVTLGALVSSGWLQRRLTRHAA
jgi:hypothetical protein